MFFLVKTPKENHIYGHDKENQKGKQFDYGTDICVEFVGFNFIVGGIRGRTKIIYEVITAHLWADIDKKCFN